jgi:mRNA interferase MazF
VVARGYVPETGDLIWLDFNPQAGREQAGRRPAVVLSPRAYNQKSSLAIVCPITSQVKGYPFEVLVPEGLSIGGVILADHLKSLDWRVRHAEKAGRLPQDVCEEVLLRIGPLLGFS